MFDRINKELRAEQKRADDKTKDELKALEKLNDTDPEKLLGGYIKHVVDRDLQQAGVMAEAAPQGNATANEVVEAIASTKSKNGSFFGGGQRKGKGSQSKNKGKDKGKKNSKGKSKDKNAKDSAKNKKASKGKGKGKKPNKS